MKESDHDFFTLQGSCDDRVVSRGESSSESPWRWPSYRVTRRISVLFESFAWNRWWELLVCIERVIKLSDKEMYISFILSLVSSDVFCVYQTYFAIFHSAIHVKEFPSAPVTSHRVGMPIPQQFPFLGDSGNRGMAICHSSGIRETKTYSPGFGSGSGVISGSILFQIWS